jgi:hypothetical protein
MTIQRRLLADGSVCPALPRIFHDASPEESMAWLFAAASPGKLYLRHHILVI